MISSPGKNYGSACPQVLGLGNGKRSKWVLPKVRTQKDFAEFMRALRHCQRTGNFEGTFRERANSRQCTVNLGSLQSR